MSTIKKIDIDKNIAIEMDSEIVDFLVKHGNFPSYKDMNDEIEEAENRLGNKLVRMQAGLEAEFINALKELGYLPANRYQQQRLVSRILEQPFRNMTETIADESLEAMELGRQLTIEDFIEQGVQLSLSSFNDSVRERLYERIYVFCRDTFDRIEGDFVGTLEVAYMEGAGIDEASEMIRKDFSNMRDYRLKRIARTEIQTAQNEGSQETMQEVGTQFKQWLTARDSRVRRKPRDQYDHSVMHGQVVRVDETFSNGMRHPADRTAEKGNFINCRCRQRPYIPRKGEVIATTPYYP